MPHKVPLSLWSELPQAVLAIAFRSLDFFSKLQVGSACKNWGQVLQQTHASIWAISVVIKLYNEGIYVQFETEKESQELVVNQEDCFRAWLSKRIRGICDLHWRRELDLSYEDLLPWEPKFLADILLCIPAPQLPKLSVDIDELILRVRDIYKVLRQRCVFLRVYTSRSTREAIQLISSFNQLVALELVATAEQNAELSDSLTNLTSLEQLTAYRFPEFPVQLSCLTALTKLRIAPSSTTPHDLSAFSQLQHLWFGPPFSNMCTPVILPCGLDNSLQTLVAASDCVLYNLGSAVNLTELIVQDSHFEKMDWPTTLVNLQRLQLQQPEEERGERGIGYEHMPAEWQHYTSLQTLILGPYEPCHSRQMPEWFTCLKQLTHLDMAGAAGLDFYSCWECFSQLQHLDLRCYDNGLREDVLALAAAPYLTYLSFADLGKDKWNGTGPPEDPSVECVQVLDCLATAIRKSRLQPSKLFRINKRPFWYEWKAKLVHTCWACQNCDFAANSTRDLSTGSCSLQKFVLDVVCLY